MPTMLPESIDDLLQHAPASHVHTEQSSAVLAAFHSWAPSFVAVAHTDGTLILWADHDAVGRAACEELVRVAACLMVSRPACNGLVPTPAGPRRLAGTRVAGQRNDELLVCLLSPEALHECAADGEISAAVAAASMWSFARARSDAVELQVRVDQISSEQDTMRNRYAESLTNAVEEHEQRLREQEAARLELHRVHAYNQLILDSVGEGIIGLDSRGHVTFANPAVQRMLGWSAEEMVGQSLAGLVRDMSHDASVAKPIVWPVQYTLESGSTVHADDERFLRKQGSAMHVEYVATPIREDEAIVGAVVTFQDITQRKLLECQLMQAQKLESIGQLAAGIAHEINTPTQFIGDNLRFLEDAFTDLTPLLTTRDLLACLPENDAAFDTGDGLGSPDALRSTDADYLLREIPKAITQSLEGVDRVANIVRSMKEFSHPDSDEMQPVDINKALECTLTVCRNEWKYCADAVLDLDPTLPLVSCLPGACNQVFLNLFVNAAHAIVDRQAQGNDAKGVITVSTLGAGEWVEVRVTDDGCGIPEPIQARIFDPFFTTKEVGKGTGQGLAIARSVVVDRHGGELSFETTVGRGTTFIVRLPRASNSA